MKSFIGRHVSVPHDWAVLVGQQHHGAQCEVLVRAASKADVTALYEEVRNVSDAAQWFAKSVRLAGAGHYRLGDRWEEVLASGVAEERGIYVCKRQTLGERVVRMDPDGAGTVLGEWVRPEGSPHHGMAFRPLTRGTGDSDGVR